MATLLLRHPRPLLTLSLTSALALSYSLPSHFRSRPLLCEAPGGLSQRASDAFRTYSTEARVPIWKDGRVNPGAYGQISLGGICGLAGGIVVSTFSKTLAILIGSAVVGIQWLEARGVHVLPRKTIQKYFSGIDVRSMLEDNMAFKLSFGFTFMLATFGEF